MEFQLASAISFKVVFWQLLLGGIQVYGRYLEGKKGVAFAFAAVILWTVFKTSGDLLFTQIIIQGIIAFFLLVTAKE